MAFGAYEQTIFFAAHLDKKHQQDIKENILK